jgi:hypothetical protein
MNRRIRNINFIPFLFIAVYFFSQSESKAQDQKMYLGYNLWFDNPREILSLNNKEGKYLPAGLEVDQVRHGRNKISFRAVKLDQKFLVIFYPKYHRGVRFEDFKNELIQPKNFQQLTAGLTQFEIDNILAGTVSPGMSKRAVLLAYGPPPQHKTRSTAENTWYYWIRKSGRPIDIKFDASGFVTEGEASEKSGAVVSTNKPAMTPTSTPTVDNAPPVIIITDPPLNRGMKSKHNDKAYIVKGNASDPSGVFEVLVNGIEANLKAGGDFWAEVLLAVGENNITITATDTKKNTAKQTFVIVREADASAPITAQPAVTQPISITHGKYYALIIGVQDYADRSINDLDQPVNDATNLKNILISDYTFEPQDVILLVNPDRTTIMRNFEELSRRVTENDNLFIFYAGHGYWDEKFQQGYWLPSDASKNHRTQWISNSTIVDYIRGIQSNHTLLVADACFSGGIFKTRSAFSDVPPAVNELYKLPSRKAMTSGTLLEVPDHSVFVEYLTKRLNENKDKYLSSEQLFVSFRTAVINNSPIQQVPQFGEIRQCGDEGGDFIFVKRK